MTNRLNPRVNGCWFFGLAGAGKTHASQVISSYAAPPFLIDGDNVRKHVSFDLGYERRDRETQINRVLGLARIAIENKTFPIASTVYMNNDVKSRCHVNGIAVIEVRRDLTEMKRARTLYAESRNVVGVDIELSSLDVPYVFNTGGEEFGHSLIDAVRGYHFD